MTRQTAGKLLAKMAENRHCHLTPACLRTVEFCGSVPIGMENPRHSSQSLRFSGETQNGPTPRANAMPGLPTNAWRCDHG